MTEQEIFEKYPTIFKEHNSTIMESCMAWGLEVNDDFYPIIDALCETFENGFWIPQGCKQKPDVIAEQVKSKFGQLRFYYHLEFKYEEDEKFHKHFDNQVAGMISMAETLYLRRNES